MSTDPPATRSNYVDLGDADFHKGLSNLHIQMIALGGAIGTGLFLGVGSRLAVAGPALIVGLALWMMFDTRNPHWYYSLCGAVILLGGLNIAYEIVRRRHPMPDSHLPIIPTPQHADPQKEHHA